jgi:hypothetical protein
MAIFFVVHNFCQGRPLWLFVSGAENQATLVDVTDKQRNLKKIIKQNVWVYVHFVELKLPRAFMTKYRTAHTSSFPALWSWCQRTKPKCLNAKQESAWGHKHINENWLALLFFPWQNSRYSGPETSHCRGFTITLRQHYFQWNSSGKVISPTPRPTTVSQAEFEPKIPAVERPKTQALGGVATWIGTVLNTAHSF